LSELPTPPARRRILRNLLLLFCGFSILAFTFLGWYVTTDSFQQRMRRRLVAELEKATGGRVELGELHTIPFRLRVDARNLIIHGREASDQAPLLHADRVQAEMKIISLVSTTVGLHSLVLQHPVIHIIDYPDGTTNLPAQPVKGSSKQSPVEQLFSLSVSQIEVQKGEAIWEDQRIPFEFSGRDLALLMNYSLLHQRYEAHVSAGSVTTHWQKYPSFDWGVDASFVLARGRADISSLVLKSGKSELHFAGQIEDFHDPRVSGEYRGSLELGELAVVTRRPEVRKGTAQFVGKGSWSLRDFSTQGTLQAKEVDWSNGKILIRNGRGEAAYSVSPSRLRVSSIKASLLGGELKGDMDVTNWQSSLESASATARGKTMGRVAAESPQRGSVRLQLAGFPLAPAFAGLSSKKLPLDRLDFAGNGSGTVDLVWVGSIRDAEGRVKLDVAPPSRLAANEIPLRGQMEGVYRGSRDELEISRLNLTTSGSEIAASGNLAAASNLHFSLVTHNAKEWTPLLEAAYGSAKLPFVVHGWANLNGNAAGRLSSPSFSGNLEAYDFDTTLPPTQRAPAQTVHWDALSTGLQYSNSTFAARNGSLIHGHTVAHFDLSTALSGGVLAEDGPFTLHLDFLNADVAEVAQWTGAGIPLGGTLGVSLNASGMRRSPHGDGHFEIRDGAAYGVSVPSFKGDVRLANTDVLFNNLEARAYDAVVTGNAAISTSNREFRANLTGRDLDLARFPRLHSTHFDVDGIVDLTAHISGTTEQPTLEAHVHVKDLAFDKERAGDFYVDGVTHGRQLDLTAHSEFVKSELSAKGTVTLENDFPADLQADFHGFDMDSLIAIRFPGKMTGHAPIDGTVHLRGPLRTPRELKASAELRAFSAEFERVKVQSAEPIRLELSDQTVLIESLHLAGSGTDFTAHGRVHLAGAREVDLGLDGSVNMALLQSLSPKVLARGTLDVNLTATGSLTEPVLQGRLDVKNTFVSHNDFPSGLSDLNGVLLFDRNRVQIQNLSGTTGGGTIALSGSASYQNGGFLLDLGATAQGVRLRYPPGVSSTANADLRLTGTTNAAILSGDVVVTKLAVTPGFDFGAYIEKSKQAGVIAQTDSVASRLRLDVHVATTPELQMQTAIARLSGNADLRVRGTAERPAILGRVEVLEGEISFNGTKYRLERGDVTFSNPAKTQPIIDLQAATRVRDYDITVRFRGDASAPNGLKVTWQSEPQLPEADVIALLALGRTREESAAAQTGGTFGFGGEASNLLINEALNSAVSSRVQRLFGVSRIKIDPQGLASETNVVRGPQLTVEQQVASNLTVTYSTNVSVSTQQIIQVEYNITRNISVVALRDQNGVVSFDFRIRRRKK
jgi:translocation and assembly module TamB